MNIETTTQVLPPLHPLNWGERLVLPVPPDGFRHAHSSLADGIGNAVAVAKTRDETRSLMMRSIHEEATDSENTMRCVETGGMQRWHNKGLQMVYPDASMCLAMLRTDVLSYVTGSDVRGRSSSMMINWPNGVDLYRSGEARACCSSTNSQPTHTIVNIYNCDSIAVEIGERERPIVWPGPSTRFCTLATYLDCGGCSFASYRLDGQTTLAKDIEDKAVRKTGPHNNQKVEHEGIDVLTTVFNLILVMQSHPEYLHDIQIKQRTDPESRKARKRTAIRVGRPIDVMPRVPFEPQQPRGTSKAGHTRVGHTRNAHWRRQRHGPLFEKQNPDVIKVVMPDGGSAHMIWIEESQISETTNEEGAE